MHCAFSASASVVRSPRLVRDWQEAHGSFHEANPEVEFQNLMPNTFLCLMALRLNLPGLADHFWTSSPPGFACHENEQLKCGASCGG